jgi:hypothetical protein
MPFGQGSRPWTGEPLHDWHLTRVKAYKPLVQLTFVPTNDRLPRPPQCEPTMHGGLAEAGGDIESNWDFARQEMLLE